MLFRFERVQVWPLPELVAPKPPLPRATYKFNAPTVTFVASLVIQLALMIFSIVQLAAGQNGRPPLLFFALWLETVVQIIELAWYLILGVLFWARPSLVASPGTFDVTLRYIDWFFSTPTMLATLYVLVYHFANECATFADFEADVALAAHIAILLTSDWAMLAIGVLLEREMTPQTADCYFLMLGFIALVVAFVPHINVLVQHYSDEGVSLIVVNLALWCLYGLVVVVWPRRSRIASKHTAYNLLDLVSKNVLGLVVSVLVAVNQDPC